MNAFPERLGYIRELKMAIKKANECNMAALSNSRKTFGRNTAMLITLARFNEGMASLNENLEGVAANANFIYIKFSVRNLEILSEIFKNLFSCINRQMMV